MTRTRTRTRWRGGLVACAVAATVATCATAAATSPPARAQSSPPGATGDTGATACPASVAPNELVLVGGTPQTALLETGFAAPLAVVLANSDGCPITTVVTGTPVTFTAPASGASATFAASGSTTLTVGTDASGSVSVQMLTADETPGAYAVTASCVYGSVSFALTNTAAGIPATITPLAPTGEHASVDSRYPAPLAVRVLDANGTPVVGATVTFSLGSAANTGAGGSNSGGAAGASFDDGTTQAMETTDADGVATSPGLRANATSGRFTATAAVQHVTEPARFALRNLAARPHAIARIGSGIATATVGSRYAHRLQARVRTAAGGPVPGVTVTFTLGGSAAGASAGTGGAGASFPGGATQATATTNHDGVATSPRLTANDQAGAFTATATATATGIAIHGLAVYHLHNHAGVPSTITAGVGADQSTAAGTRFAIPLAVTVTDAHANHPVDVPVTFTAPASGAGGTFPNGQTRVVVRTNASGIAVAPAFTANTQPGGYIVTATVHGIRPVAFALVNTTT